MRSMEISVSSENTDFFLLLRITDFYIVKKQQNNNISYLSSFLKAITLYGKNCCLSCKRSKCAGSEEEKAIKFLHSILIICLSSNSFLGMVSSHLDMCHFFFFFLEDM